MRFNHLFNLPYISGYGITTPSPSFTRGGYDETAPAKATFVSAFLDALEIKRLISEYYYQLLIDESVFKVFIIKIRL